MSTKIIRFALPAALMMALAAATTSFAQDKTPAKEKAKSETPAAPIEEPKLSEADLIKILKSDATREEKSSACRRLSIVGTGEAIPTLAELLEDEALSHMARYALEPIRDPAVDAALREAITKVKGRLLVGVIGSIGVRRDTKAVETLTGLLKNGDPLVVGAAAKALGSIGNDGAVKALEQGLADAPPAHWPGYYEGLFRGADAMAGSGKTAEAVAIYGRLNQPECPPQVREGAARKARILTAAQGRGL
jgi:HEAT repeat protein